tara:strand:- start:14775 stop:15605 length:831 start_codon:yes stop_codon:yes gene_type:complete
MKAATSAYSWAQPKSKLPALAAYKLASIKVKDYSLIGFRDHEAETEILANLDFRIPRLYTLVSQNRKISINETLCDSSRFFLNFESFKWSELFYGFFRQIISPKTEHFIFQQLLYSLDIYVCQFQLLVNAVKNSPTGLNGALHRHHSQLELITLLQKHQHGEKLCLLFIFELLLISLGKDRFASCATFVNKMESQVLLRYFSSQDLIIAELDKLFYSSGKLRQSLKKYFEFRGQILFTENSKNIFSEKMFFQLGKIFEQNETVLEHKTFETCFTHI